MSQTDEENKKPSFNPEMLGLQEIGDDQNSTPTYAVNRRGTPARIRKKNKFYYDDEMITTPFQCHGSGFRLLPVAKRSAKKSNTPSKTPTPKPVNSMPSKSVNNAPSTPNRSKVRRDLNKETQPLSPDEKPSPTKTEDSLDTEIDTSSVSSSSSSSSEKSSDEDDEFDNVRDFVQSPMSPELEPKLPLKRSASSSPEYPFRHFLEESNSAKGIDPLNKLAAHLLGVRLRNLLKLPKAHKWVIYEFFYSHIDRTIFLGENDFMICLRESFPRLKTRLLRRMDWCKIRRLMGRPRRCSQIFFEQERSALSQKRKKIRMLQLCKPSDLTPFKDLPADIPLQLSIGTKVTARVRRPQDGIFTGVIEGVDTSDNTYRITFHRTGLGTHSVSDFEVMSNEVVETMPLTSFALKHRPRINNYLSTPIKPPSPVNQFPIDTLNSDPILGHTPNVVSKSKLFPKLDGHLGGFSVKFLVQIVRLSKILEQKRYKINTLKEMNQEAERRFSLGEGISGSFQMRYASLVMELNDLNRDLDRFVQDVQMHCQALVPDTDNVAWLQPAQLRERCRLEAEDLIRAKSLPNTSTRGETTGLVTALTGLLLQVKCVSEGEVDAIELQSLQDCISDIRSSVQPSVLPTYQNSVEVHMQHILAGLCTTNLTTFNGVLDS